MNTFLLIPIFYSSPVTTLTTGPLDPVVILILSLDNTSFSSFNIIDGLLDSDPVVIFILTGLPISVVVEFSTRTLECPTFTFI
jgi:hypothetical protein